MKSYRMAPLYDIMLNPFLKEVRLSIKKIIDNHKFTSVLDICCGTGDQLSRIKGVPELTGIDISSSMLKTARSKKGAFKCFLQDASSLAFKDNSFDCSMITLGLHEKPVKLCRQILKEMNRVTKTHGHLIIVDYCISTNTPLWASILVKTIERIAGKDHYKHFKNFIDSGGVTGMVQGMPWNRHNTEKFATETLQLLHLTKK